MDNIRLQLWSRNRKIPIHWMNDVGLLLWSRDRKIPIH